jgi:P27 family predicted phage terminase small subunit
MNVPKHLTAEARRIWRNMVAEWQFDDATLMILRQALEAFDRLNQAREAITRDGLTILGPSGQRAHPALLVEKDSRNALLRAWRQLGLDVEAPLAHGRPPGGNRREN